MDRPGRPSPYGVQWDEYECNEETKQAPRSDGQNSSHRRPREKRYKELADMKREGRYLFICSFL